MVSTGSQSKRIQDSWNKRRKRKKRKEKEEKTKKEVDNGSKEDDKRMGNLE